MNNALNRVITVLLIVAAFVAGYFLSQRNAGLSAKGETSTKIANAGEHDHMAMQGSTTQPIGPSERKVLYWYDSMNPKFQSDKPGIAPDGMQLVPKYADESSVMPDMPAGTVKLSAQKQQMIGVRTGVASKQNLSRTIRTVGHVEMDETRISHIHVKYTGWIENLKVDYTGKLIEKGQPLFSIYSPDLVATQQEYLIASRGQENLSNSAFPNVTHGTESLKNAARERLRLWDVSDAQIEKLTKSGEVSRTVTFYSPISGFVIERKAFEHVYATPDLELYTIADLSHVWITADIYENELPYVHVGQMAKVQLAYAPGTSYVGKVTFVYPTVDPNTRTAKVRMEFANPGFNFKPNMFADVDITVNYGEQLTIPTEAVLDSGIRQLVFIAKDDGYFVPREVKLGARIENQYIVISGIKSGERIVTSGNFLIDSESRLNSATNDMKH